MAIYQAEKGTGSHDHTFEIRYTI